MNKRYKHLFFDLDHTLWDHHSCANDTLNDLYYKFELGNFLQQGVDIFQTAFHKVNHHLWQEYHLGNIDQAFIRKERFKKVLDSMGVSNFHHYAELSKEYLFRCPRKSNLMPHALESLEYLKTRYPMTIITNGFAEIQDIKLSYSGLHGYFDQVVTSEESGTLKPHPEIFDFALQQAAVSKSDSVMIGDNPITDIAGAQNAGIDQIYYDPGNLDEVAKPTHRIQSLLQLKELL